MVMCEGKFVDGQFYAVSDSSLGKNGSLSDSEGQPGGTAPPVHRSGPQARMGAVQRVCAHHQELHTHCH